MRHRLGVPRAARYSLGWDLLAGSCTGAYMGLTFPFFVKIARGQLGAPEAAIALMSAAPFIGNLLAPIWARQMEGRAKMPFVLGSWLGSRLLLFLTPLAILPWLFAGLVGTWQFIGTISSPAYTSLMKDIYPDRTRGRLMGYVRVGSQTCLFVSTFFAGRLLDKGVPYTVLFPVAGVLGLLAAYAFSRVRPLVTAGVLVHDASSGPPVSAAKFAWETVSILRDNIAYRWFAMSVFTYGFGNLMAIPLYQLYQVDILHIRGAQIANLTNFASLWSIAGMFFWGRFMDRRGAPVTVLWAICCIALIPIVYLLTSSVPGLLFASALSGFGLAGIELSYLASILLYARPGRAAQYQALHSFLLGVRGVLAPLIGIPLMRHFGFKPVFALTLVVMLVGAVTQWFAARPVDRNVNEPTPQ